MRKETSGEQELRDSTLVRISTSVFPQSSLSSCASIGCDCGLAERIFGLTCLEGSIVVLLVTGVIGAIFKSCPRCK